MAPITVLDRPDANGPIKDDWIPNLAHEVPDVGVFIEQARRFRWDLKDMQHNEISIKILRSPNFLIERKSAGTAILIANGCNRT